MLHPLKPSVSDSLKGGAEGHCVGVSATARGAEVLLTGAPPKVFSVDTNYLDCSSYLIMSFSVLQRIPSIRSEKCYSIKLSEYFFF